MIEAICLIKHQRVFEGERRPRWIYVDEVLPFDSAEDVPEEFFDLLVDPDKQFDLLTVSEEILLSGRIELDTIKTFMRERFGIDLGKKQLNSSVRELLYARNNMPLKPLKDDDSDFADLK